MIELSFRQAHCFQKNNNNLVCQISLSLTKTETVVLIELLKIVKVRKFFKINESLKVIKPRASNIFS